MTNSTVTVETEGLPAGPEPSLGQQQIATEAAPPKLRKTEKSIARPGGAGIRSRPKGGTANSPALTKSELVLRKLGSSKGATLEQLMETTGWQAHSVRGFLSGTVKKKLGLHVASEISKDGVRRYRVVPEQAA